MSQYPTTLPNPTKADHKPRYRVHQSDLPGPTSYSSRETDYSGTLDVEFFFTAEQAEEFYTWWKTALAYGGCWFSCSWPALRPGSMVCQFLAEPSFDHVYMGAHRVSATVQVRGASLPVYALSGSGIATEDGSYYLLLEAGDGIIQEV